MNKQTPKTVNTARRQGEEIQSPAGSFVRLVKINEDIIQKWW